MRTRTALRTQPLFIFYSDRDPEGNSVLNVHFTTGRLERHIDALRKTPSGRFWVNRSDTKEARGDFLQGKIRSIQVYTSWTAENGKTYEATTPTPIPFERGAGEYEWDQMIESIRGMGPLANTHPIRQSVAGESAAEEAPRPTEIEW